MATPVPAPGFSVTAGSPHPLGATPAPGGVNFSLFSQNATGVELLLFAKHDSPQPFQTIQLDAAANKTFHFWHVFVLDLRPGTHYAYRVSGPFNPSAGQRFNSNKVLIDPYACGNTKTLWSRVNACGPDDNVTTSMRSVVIDSADYDWEGDQPLNRPMADTIIYEMHVGGFTRHPSAAVAKPGCFAGMKEKIPYLQALGVTHVELLPVMAFDTQDVPANVAKRGLCNYWGYSTHSFFALHPGYCSNHKHAREEFRDLVDALHAAGIRVLLDVVFNHTAEGGQGGPIINFKGLANDIFYHLDAADRRRYLDFTGCGNTVNCNHPLVSAFIVRCLDYWVEELGVDGFRFDLASVFARGDRGVPLSDPPLPWALETSRTLAELPLIAEAWDAAGLYQVGAFPGMAWSEWNGRYRDVMRRFVRGEPGLIGEVATRIAGSADLYAHTGRTPASSINFITCHDGFTLYDLASYDSKHNEANGEDNRDGSNDNLSWNCGAEGNTEDSSVLALRVRQAKNLLAILMLSRGVPMFCAGDEVLRTQQGNNNAYCQDNELAWFDWRLVETNRDMLRYTRELIALRRRHSSLTVDRFFRGMPQPRGGPVDILWHGARLNEPLWNDSEARMLAFTIAGRGEDEEDLHVILNMSEEVLDVPLPVMGTRRWYLALDTVRAAPSDILARAQQEPLRESAYRVGARSVVVLEARAWPRITPQLPSPISGSGHIRFRLDRCLGPRK